MQGFSLDHLTDTEFEEYCFDLLSESGFVNLNWRKGTGLSSGPSDQGRDIECRFERRDVDGRKYFEKWFVECKHYKSGVSVQPILGALAWAEAERPQVLLIIASNFLSNSTKAYLEDYTRNNRPPYRVIYWERPQLESMTVTKSRLARKYGLGPLFPFLSIMHPAHVLYLKSLHNNTLDYFFEILDKLDRPRLDEALGITYHTVIAPRYREPMAQKETMGDLRLDEVSYRSFKEACYRIADTDIISESMLVLAIVSEALSLLLSRGDTTSSDEARSRLASALEHFREKLAAAQSEGDKYLYSSMVARFESQLQTLDQDIRLNYDLYSYFCREVVEPLLIEELPGLKLPEFDDV